MIGDACVLALRNLARNLRQTRRKRITSRSSVKKLEKCDDYLRDNKGYLDKSTREGFKSQFKRVKKKIENIEEILKNDVDN